MARKPRRANATGRNAHSQFILLHHYVLNCLAWKSLSPSAKALLLAVWQRHNGTNNGEISFSVREAANIGLSKDQASRAFNELMERGFLKVHRQALFTTKNKEARTWEITAERFGDNAPSKDFMRLSPAP